MVLSSRRFQAPSPNCYEVLPRKLLAGEYPGTKDKQRTAISLSGFLDYGVTCFVDLTESRELRRYEQILRGVAAGSDRRVDYHRFAIRDVDVPSSRVYTIEILDCIDSAMNAGHCVYLHCWGGVGRTGTIVGCWLVRHGLTGTQALARVARLWKTVEKSERKPCSPETAQQCAWIQNWSE